MVFAHQLVSTVRCLIDPSNSYLFLVENNSIAGEYRKLEVVSDI